MGRRNSDDGCLTALVIIVIVISISPLIFAGVDIFFSSICDNMNWSIGIVIAILLLIIYLLYNHIKSLDRDIEKNIEYIDKKNKEIERLEAQIESGIQNLTRERKANDILQRTVKSNFPFSLISSLYADVELAVFKAKEKEEEIKETCNKRSSVIKVRELEEKSRGYIKLYKEIMYKYEFLLKSFPELSKYVEDYESLKQITECKNYSELESDTDLSYKYITKEEWNKLSIDSRNQLALDRYINSTQKSKWAIGRDYELYVGYAYRNRGWCVSQYGIEKRLEDLGRDLIASRYDDDGLHILVIQCKMWSSEKEIHENTICQLFGTTIQYKMENVNDIFIGKAKVEPMLVTTTKLSDTAMKFARYLGVRVEVLPMGNFPRIKCNIGNDGEKIYHLPFDQQYDNVKISKKGECYVYTVKQAVDLGFRRAYRYCPYNDKQ